MRQEVFSLRGGLWFNTYHLLNYPGELATVITILLALTRLVPAKRMAFQSAVMHCQRVKAGADGDLIAYGSNKAEALELAVRKLSTTLSAGDSGVASAGERG